MWSRQDFAHALRASTNTTVWLWPAQAPEGQAEVQKESPWRARMRYAKIGAAAVGGGALLAVTGGLFIAN